MVATGETGTAAAGVFDPATGEADVVEAAEGVPFGATGAVTEAAGKTCNRETPA